jgi:hypothetical protein
MKDQSQCEYVVLVYASAPAQERPVTLAVVARDLVASDTRRLILHVTAALPTGTSSRHLEYVHDLFESWREVSGDSIDQLFEEIRDLSSDLLRAESSGFCSVANLRHVVDHALGTTENPNSSRVAS